MSHKWLVLTAVACGTFMATLDSSIVNIALPTLTKQLSADLSQVKWVIIAYFFAITCLLLPFGRLADLYGRKKTFWIGFFIFTLGSGLCGFSEALLPLVLSRMLQGVGAAMLMANGPALITACVPGKERGKALGILAMVVSAGLVSGPSIGGFLITHFGWKSIFFVNIPVGIMGMALVYFFIPKDQKKTGKKHFDWAGAAIQFFLLISVMVLFDPPSISVSGGDQFLVPRWVWGVITIVLTVLFIKIESDSKSPLFDFSLLKIRTFSLANLASFITFVSYSSIAVLMPFYLEEVLQLNTDRTGYFMTAIPLTIFVVAPISGRLSDRLGSRELSAAGALILSLALLLSAGMIGEGLALATAPFWIVLLLIAVGFGMGLFQSPNNNAILGSITKEKLGSASALLATIRNLGLVIGASFSTGIFSWQLEKTQNMVYSFHVTHLVMGILASGAIIASLAKPKGPHWSESKRNS